FYTCTTLDKSINFSFFIYKLLIRSIALYVTICCLFSDGTNCSRSEYFIFTKYIFCIFMGFWLIFPGKIQVDIRHLIPLKAQKRFKWNILTVLQQICPALWTWFILQVKSTSS